MTNTFVTLGYIEGNFKITLILLKSAVETKSRNVGLVTWSENIDFVRKKKSDIMLIGVSSAFAHNVELILVL